jgi:dihydrodipicolinate synthase/N-acetylneuraminate lyase
MSRVWSGVLPALTTPFRDDFGVDHAALAAHIEQLLGAGIHGLVVLGSLGENGSLRSAEKLAILETAVGACSGHVPVLAGVAEPTPQEAEEVIQKMADRGADGIMLLPPMRYRPDRRETLAYLAGVAGGSPLPVMIYNNPVAYGTDITPEMFAELARVSSIVALKESSDNPRRITDIIRLTGERYRIFVGVDDLALESFLLGATGWVAGLVCAFPEESVALYGLARTGRWEEARSLYRWFMPLLHLDASPRFVHHIKLVQELRGLGCARVRPPRLPLPEDERSQIEALLRVALDERAALEPLIHLGLETSKAG